jgi:hypothetical protein
MLWIGLEVGQEFMSTAARLADAGDLEDAVAGKRAPTDANTDPYQHGLPAGAILRAPSRASSLLQG